MQAVIHDDTVGVVNHLGLVAGLDGPAQPSLGDRPGIGVVQRHHPDRAGGHLAGETHPGLRGDRSTSVAVRSSSANSATVLPVAGAVRWRRPRRALRATRRASATACSAMLATSRFTTRIITVPDCDIVEDRIVTTTGSYAATATQNSNAWVMQMATFKAAGQ